MKKDFPPLPDGYFFRVKTNNLGYYYVQIRKHAGIRYKYVVFGRKVSVSELIGQDIAARGDDESEHIERMLLFVANKLKDRCFGRRPSFVGDYPPKQLSKVMSCHTQ